MFRSTSQTSMNGKSSPNNNNNSSNNTPQQTHYDRPIVQSISHLELSDITSNGDTTPSYDNNNNAGATPTLMVTNNNGSTNTILDNNSSSSGSISTTSSSNSINGGGINNHHQHHHVRKHSRTGSSNGNHYNVHHQHHDSHSSLSNISNLSSNLTPMINGVRYPPPQIRSSAVSPSLTSSIGSFANYDTIHDDSESVMSSNAGAESVGDLELKLDLDFTTSDIPLGELEDLEELLRQYAPTETIIADCYKKGIDIKQYSEEVEAALLKYDQEMKEMYQDIIPDYVNERETFALMYKTLKESNNLLTGFEQMLLNFQSNLTNISKEMKELQEKSISKSVKCNNRKNVVEKLNKVIDELSIPDDIIHLLSIGEVNDQYLQYLSIFSRKIGHFESQKMNNVAATDDVANSVQKLLSIVLEKINRFFVNQFQMIKTVPNLHSKQQEFTLYRQAFFFLYRHSGKLAKQLFEQYKDLVERLYASYSKDYFSFLSKLQFDPTTKNDLIGTSENKNKGFFSSKTNKLNIKSSIFSVESRYKIMSELDCSPLQPQSLRSSNAATTQSNQIKYTYEVIFRSMIFFILDLISFESMYVKEFFLTDLDCTSQIFAKPEAIYMDNLNSYLSTTYDPIAILFIICITNKYRLKSTTKSDCSDRIFQQSIFLSLNRFNVIMSENIDSIKNANIRELCPIEENRPHYVIRRYAELIGSISTLSQHLPQEILPNVREYLDMFRAVVPKLLIRMSDEIKEKNNRSIFLLNNYDLILTILTENETPNTDDKNYFTVLYEQESELFAMEQLTSYPYFKEMIVIVKELYPLINKYTVEEINSPKLKKEIHEVVLKDFYQNWRTGIEEMNVIVTQLFPNFRNGMKIFQIILDRLFNIYKQFTQIILKCFKSLKSSNHFIPETEISYEIKKYYVSFD